MASPLHPILRPAPSDQVVGAAAKSQALTGGLRVSVCLFVVMCGVVAVSYAYFLKQVVLSWQRPEYEAGMLIPVLAAVVLWAWRRPLTPSSGAEQLLGVAVIAVMLLTRYVSWIQYGVQQPVYYTMIGCVGGLVVMLGGIRMLGWTWPALLLLTFAMPLSAKMEDFAFQRLQSTATSWSVYALETLGVDVENVGNNIKLLHGTEEINLNVAEACAGFKGMLTAFSVMLAIVFLIPSDAWHWNENLVWAWIKNIILVFSAIPVSIFANVLRLVIQCAAYGVSPWFADFFHDWLAGFVVYPVVFGLLYLEYRTLQNLILEDEARLILPRAPLGLSAPGIPLSNPRS